jgi:hypothetical protein
MEKLSASQAAKLLNISIKKLTLLEKKGIIHPTHNTERENFYSSEEIARIKSRRGPTLSEEAAQVALIIQREMVSSIIRIQKALAFTGGILSGYILLVAFFIILFIIHPLQTAQFLGMAKSKTEASTTQKNQYLQVLGAATNILQEKINPIQTILQPIGKVSLGLVKNISPQSYAQVSKVVILDTNEALSPDENGTMTPVRPINLPESSLLKVGSNGLVANLNSQYLQGKKPGKDIGDIAVIGANGKIDGLIEPTTIPVEAILPVQNVILQPTATPTQTPAAATSTTTASDLTNANLSGSAGITNANLANSTLTVETSSPLSGGGSVALGSTITLACPTCTTSVSSLFTASSIDTLTNKTINSTDNTITNLSTSNFGSANISQWNNNAGFITSSSSDILTNKSLSGSTNTLINIGNSSLSHSNITFAGNTGSGDIALGGTLMISGSGINTASYSGGTITLTGTEADTLESVFNRGNTISTTTGSTPNTIDSATINIGNIASSAQQNFSTLNFSNGGTGFLDVELIRGFINSQGMNTLYDDFTSKSLDTTNRWTSTVTGAGSTCAILAGGVNGLFRMHSGGGANRGCELTTQAIASLTNGYYQRNNNPIFETKVKINTTTNARIFAGFTDTRIAAANETSPNTHHAYIAKKATDTTWQCVTDDGGATETTTNTGVTIVANTYYRLRVELRNGTTPETICTVDDGTTVTRTVVTNMQPGATNPIDVYVKLNQSDAIVKNMDIDYVRAWQDDSPVSPSITDDNPTPEITPTDTENILDVEKIPPVTTPALEETTATHSGNLSTSMSDVIKSLFKNLVEFFGNVIFHGDITFLGRPVFNKDTAGHAFIQTGTDEVAVIFEKEYTQNPVVYPTPIGMRMIRQGEFENYRLKVF